MTSLPGSSLAALDEGSTGGLGSGSDYIYVKGGRPDLPTLIGFSSVNTPRGLFKPFRIYDQLGANLIILNDHGNHWYQDGIRGVSSDTREAALRIVDFARKLGNGRVSTFGTSMGAAGAALFASLGEADACMAFGMEPVLCEAGSRSAIHLPAQFKPRWHDIREVISGSSAAFFAYASESDEADLRGALALKDLDNVVQFSIVGCEHPGLQVFHFDNSLDAMLTSFACDGRPPSGFPRQGWLLSRWGAVEALLNAEEHRRNNRLDRGIHVLEIANRKFPSEPNILSKLGNFYQAARRRDEAVSAWNTAVAICPANYGCHGKLANHHLRANNANLAYEHAKAGYDIYPRSSIMCHILGVALTRLNRRDEAILMFEKSIKISPNNELFKKTLIDARSAG